MKRSAPKSKPAASSDTAVGTGAAEAEAETTAPRKRARQLGSKAMKTLVSAQKELDGRGKLVRGTFSMPRDDYALIDLLKKRAVAAGRPTKKNELLRAGLHALLDSGRVELCKALDRLPAVAKRKDD